VESPAPNGGSTPTRRPNIFPELFKIPWLDAPLPSYGVLVSLALIAAFSLAAHLIERDGMDGRISYRLAIFVLPAALLGTKLLALIVADQSVAGGSQQAGASDPALWVGAYFGGLLPSLAVSVVVLRYFRVPWRNIADAAAPALALGNVIGRIGCFAGGCCWGKPTDSWLGVMFTEKAHQMNGVPFDVPLLPTQLFQAAISLVSFFFLLWLWKRRAFAGQVILCFLMLYSVERFVIEFWRDDPRGQLLGFSTSQFISIVLFPLALAFMIYWSRENSRDRLKAPYEIRLRARLQD
jgi:phosphatidylglycerol---prolipoprotein diacylglyceryl transferase